MTARIIDGKMIAADLRGKVTDAVHRLRRDRGLVPGLAVVLVGENPASEVYVRNKSKAVAECRHARRSTRSCAETTSEAELLDLIATLNADPQVNGILVQLPLPPQIDTQKVIAAIDPDKDVDGFHPLNVGRLASGLPGLVPCTPLGCVLLAKTVHDSLAGLEAVVIGRSNIVGKPVAQLLLAENATVTIDAFEDARSARRVPPRRSCSSPRSAGRRWCAATGSSRAPRSSTSASTASKARAAKSRIVGDVAREVARGRRRHHAGARWRRADDDCLPAAQHVARGLPAKGPAAADVLN